MKKKFLKPLVMACSLSLLAFGGMFTWWNTDLFGEQNFCGGKIESSDIASVLDTRGRISQTASQGGSADAPEFHCTIQRTSFLLGTDDMKVTLSTRTKKADFQFQTRAWPDPAGMSFFTGGATGAVSDTRGWIMLPESCWDRVGMLYRGNPSPGNAQSVTTVEAVLDQGEAGREELAGMLARTAQRVADVAGCSGGGKAMAPGLRDAGTWTETDPGHACGLAGFALPGSAFVSGKAEKGEERTAGDSAETWACDVRFSGSSESQASFSVTSDADITKATLRQKDFRDLPNGTGRINPDSAVLKCGDTSVYFGMNWNDEYRDLNLDQGKDHYTENNRKLFQSFVDAAGKKHHCPDISVPRR
ncbi:hypothetical protein ACIQ7D_25595 [Streptomyces sp. NPDC096310]|uniref:hypothetical protein n=1 Tax=Streptomyces sp. NPDC096310 TaxID=3366082 RepID=UPI0037F79B71